MTAPADLDEDVDVEDPEIRRAKFVLFLLTIGVLTTFTLVLLIFFQPDNQLVVTRYPNGYPKTETHYVMDDVGRLIEHGDHVAYHEDGRKAEEGEYLHGKRVGPWRFWNEDGVLDETRSGHYADGERTRQLERR